MSKYAAADIADRIDDVKRALRQFKQMEIKLLYDGVNHGRAMIWDGFFGARNPKYPFTALAAMDRARYKTVIGEYFAMVYYEYYKRNGLNAVNSYDPGLLAKLGLSFDAGEDAVKGRFRELAKQYHPDMGGDADKFIELMEVYRAIAL